MTDTAILSPVRRLEAFARATDGPLLRRLAEPPDAGRNEALRRAADQGDSAAAAELGIRLLSGRGTPSAPKEGASWVKSAADLGDPEALAIAATLAGLGAFQPQNWDAALDLLCEAAVRGLPAARAQLQILAHAPTADGAEGGDPDVWRALRSRIDIEAWITPPARRPVWEAPRVRIAEGFAPAVVCDWLRARAQGRMRPAMMYHGDSKTEVIDPHRTCSDFQFDLFNTDLVLLLVRQRISAITQLPTVAMEPPRIFHYALGEQIKPHYDRCGDGVGGYGREGSYLGDRIATFLLYLNDDFEGGDLNFPKVGFQCKGAKGDAVYFAHVDAAGRPDPLSLHAGLMVTAGEKWVLSQWIHDRPFGAPEPAGAAGRTP
jgi:hypothetical protein